MIEQQIYDRQLDDRYIDRQVDRLNFKKKKGQRKKGVKEGGERKRRKRNLIKQKMKGGRQQNSDMGLRGKTEDTDGGRKAVRLRMEWKKQRGNV